MKAPGMKSSLALLAQGVIVLVGFAILTFMLVEPHLEGRNAHATTYQIYFNDPFLAYVYVASIPFFVALYRGFGLFGHVRRSGSFSPDSVRALRAITYCALIIIGFVAGAFVIIFLNGDPDDRPAGFFMGMLVVLACTTVATTAAFFARKLQGALSQASA